LDVHDQTFTNDQEKGTDPDLCDIARVGYQSQARAEARAHRKSDGRTGREEGS
jgi:hypothetical protein